MSPGAVVVAPAVVIAAAAHLERVFRAVRWIHREHPDLHDAPATESLATALREVERLPDLVATQLEEAARAIVVAVIEARVADGAGANEDGSWVPWPG